VVATKAAFNLFWMGDVVKLAGGEESGEQRTFSALRRFARSNMESAPTFANRFVGRAGERVRLVRLIASRRLVTVIGAPGVGKTRLVAEAVEAWERRFPGGRWWLDLASIRDPDLVERFLADQLGLRARPHRDLPTAVAARFAGQPALLVFDNCEHLLADVASRTSGLLASSASLRVLATSRESLGIAGEALLPIDPLANEDAVRLFVDCARACRPEFQPVGHARVELSRLCERIDNLPLAVELAAARAAHLSPKDMLDRLDRRFDLLRTPTLDVPDRHRTLLAALDWSYRLLDPSEQQRLNRLAVLAGGFDLAAVETVGEPGTLDGLGRLIDKSLVVARPTPRGMRYRLLEAVRDYGLERLSEAGG
jgi:predicted ATPase